MLSVYLRVGVLLSVCLNWAGSAAVAATVTWTGSVDSSWSDSGNWAGGVPQTGDRLSFFDAPGTRTSSNDLTAGIVYDDITFLDGGYTLGGNAIGLTNGIVNNSGSFNTVNLPITLHASQTFDRNLLLGGTIDIGSYTLSLGNGGFGNIAVGGDVTGSGTVTVLGQVSMSGNKTYTGPTQITDNGRLTLDGATLASNAVSLSGFGSTSLLGSGTIGPLTASSGSNVQIAPSGIIHTGHLSLGANTYLSLWLSGPTAGVDYGQLNVTGSVTLTSTARLSFGVGYAPALGQKFMLIDNDDDDDPVNGIFHGLPEGSTIEIDASEFVLSYVGGDGNDVELTCTVAAKTWSGAVDNLWSKPGNWGGQLPDAGDPLVFPDSASNKNNNNDLASQIYAQLLFTGGSYTLGGNAIGLTNGIVNNSGSFNTVNLPITLHASQTFDRNLLLGGTIDIGSYTLSLGNGGFGNIAVGGDVTGSGTVTVLGQVSMSGNKTYTGPTQITDNGRLTLDGATLASNAVSLSGFGSTSLLGSGTIGPLTASSGSNVQIAPSGIIHTGHLSLGANTYLSLWLSGPTAGVDYGQLNVTGSVTLTSTARLSFGVGYAPALGQKFMLIDNDDDDDPVNGIFHGLPEGSTIEIDASEFVLSYVGGDGNDVELTCTVAAKTWSGAVDNLWSKPGNWGGQLPDAGDPLVFPDSASNKNNNNDLASQIYAQLLFTGGSYTLGGNAIGLTNGIVNNSGSFNTVNLPITLHASQTFDRNLLLGGTIDIGSYTLSLGNGGFGNIAVGGDVTGSGTVTVLGQVSMSGNKTYTGPTQITDNGRLTLDGATLASNAVSLSGFGSTSLLGSGTIGPLTASSGSNVQIAPSGIIHTGHLSLGANTYLSLWLSGPTAGVDYGQLNVTGSVTLTSTARLNFGLGYVPAVGQEFVLINNDDDEAISGTFHSLPEGSIIHVGPYPFQLTYLGGTGNDVTLTSQSGDPLNTAPVANNDSYNAYQDTPLTVPTPGVLLNDNDAEMHALSVTVYSPTSLQGGTVVVNPNGSFTYTPPLDHLGPDSFTYVVSDGNNGTDTATVNLTVLLAPTATPTLSPTLTPTPSPTATPSATPTETTAPVCGDGVLQANEQCDDGNHLAGDDCPSAPGEQCRYDGELIRGHRRPPERSPFGCQLEWYVANPNQPLDRFGLPSYRQECRDQDASCDFDPTPGRCRFRVVTCLNNLDSNLPACTPRGVSRVHVYRPRTQGVRPSQFQAALEANRDRFEDSLQHLLDPQNPGSGYSKPIPLTAVERDHCSAGFDVDIPLLGSRRRSVNLMARSWDDDSPRRRAALSRLQLICRQ